jgi:hypothetical protein
MKSLTVLVPLIALLLLSCNENKPHVIPGSENRAMKITYLKKANDDVISFCSCGDGRVTFPAQMDCPWCGCGWLFTCITCRKAFTFADGIEIEGTWEEIARDDIRNRSKKQPSEEEIASWIDAMKEILADVRVGGRYVIIDGSVIRSNARNITFNGWAAHHEFKEIPQVRALTDKALLKDELGSREYWSSRYLEPK